MSYQVHNEDCLAGMANLAENSIDAIVTDPPYGLSFMGKGWDHGIPGEDYWRAAMRCAKPGAYLLAFGGTRTYHRLTCAIEDAGWEIRDCIMWVYGSGFPKSLNLDGEREGWGTALKPAFEPIILARKPLVGTVAKNVAEFGTGAMNIDDCRVGTDDVSSSAIRKPGVQKFNGDNHRPHHDGEATPTVHGSQCGRWPANLIHDGSDEVLQCFPHTQSGDGKSGSKTFANNHSSKTSGQNAYGKYADAPHLCRNDSGSAARFFYCAKASKADRDEGMDNAPERLMAASNQAQAQLKRGEDQKGTSGVNTIKVRKNNHPTVKPTALMRYLCKLVTPTNGLILDPFTGSGSTGKAALLEGFRFVGFELEAEYAAIARARCAAVAKQTPLLEAV